MAYQEKLDSMTRTVAHLDGEYNLLVPTFGTELSVALRRAKEISEVAIKTLKGIDTAKGDINPWQAAIDSDDYLRDSWLPLAEQTDANMRMALGLSKKWELGNLFINGYDNVSNAAVESRPSPLSLLTIAVVAVAVIFIAIR